MLRAIVWKEVREQGLIGLTLVAFGAALLSAAAALADPPTAGVAPSDVIRYLGLGLLATLMLAVTAGMVCGGAVFAAEREAGTMGFLESLPVSRLSLWYAKLVAGVGLAVVQSGLLVAVAAALGLLPSIAWAVSIAVCSLLAFVWGLFGSTAARTTLGSIGLAIPVAGLTALLLLFPVALFFQAPRHTASLRPMGTLIFLAGMFIVPVLLSAWIFTAQDRHRAMDPGPSVAVPGTPVRARRRAQRGLWAVVWMTQRQLRVPGLVLSAFAIVFGLGLLAPESRPVIAWPGLALAAGVLAGVTAFSDEQSRGVARFWGEQRLPLGRVWAVKLALHALFCLWLLVLLVLPLVLQTQFGNQDRSARGHTALAVVFRSLLFDELERNGWAYLLVPAVYGFVAGHVCGLTFRKTVVACGVAGILGGAGALAWGPSLVAGGVRAWQLWLPPVVALATARAVMAAWAADRLFDRGPFTRLIVGVAAVALALTAGIGYRILQVPSIAGGEDDVQYVGQLPTLDENVARREFRTAADRFGRVAGLVSDLATAPATSVGQRSRIEERAEASVLRGWPADDPELDAWLARVFEPPPGPDEVSWHATAAAAADLPVGVFEYPQFIGLATRDPVLPNAHRMAYVLLAHGLQQQAAGDPVAFLTALRVSLKLAQTMRNGSVVTAFQTGTDIERAALLATDRWIEGFGRPALVLAAIVGDGPHARALARATGRPDLVRAALGHIVAAAPREPFDPRPHFLAERYVIREAMKGPTQWLPMILTPLGENLERANPEVELVAVAWAVPWERERTRRLLGLGYETARMPEATAYADPAYLTGRPGARLIPRPRHPQDLVELDRGQRGYRAAAVLKLALHAHQVERGRYPEALTDLVATGYLSQLPEDPHDETRGFGYRVTPPAGEYLQLPTRAAPVSNMPTAPLPASSEPPVARYISAGQAVLWTVGPDRTDQGGTSLPLSGTIAVGRPEDCVYLVPHALTPPPTRRPPQR